jgi:hypothetical protein
MTWTTINKIIGKHKDMSSLADSFPGKSKSELTNDFCKYFQSIGPSLASTIPEGKYPYDHYMGKSNGANMFVTPTDKNEIIKLISSLKNSKSSGHDNISSVMFKKIKDSIALPLSNLINMSISSGTLPNALKIAKVVPIFKSGDHSELGNYRPISILPACSKIYEKVMYKRLYHFLLSNNILYKSQYGFRSKHSTVHAVTELVEDILDGFENKEFTLAVFIDLSKAFDTINHKILIKKLLHYGVRGQALEWFMSYLSNRQHYIAIDEKSETLPITCGVPQGSILGPLLFIIYTNDLPTCLKDSHPILFADDTTVYLKGKSLNKLYQTMNAELDSLSEWFKTNRLSLNVKKTNYLLFSRNKVHGPCEVQLVLNNTHIEIRPYFKFLGILIDEGLSWESHISKLANKLTSSLYALKSVKNCMTGSALRALYFAIFQSHINYGLILWGSATKKYIKRIWILQKKAIRVITNQPYNAHTNPLFHKLKILKLEDIHMLQLGQFMHKMCHTELPDPLNSKLVINAQVHHHNTRTSTNPRRPQIKTSIASNSIYYQSSGIFCNMDLNIRNIQQFSVFSSKLKSHIIQQYCFEQ